MKHLLIAPLLIVLVGCSDSSSDDTTPTPTPDDGAVEATATEPESSPSPRPTNTPPPTATEAPSGTSRQSPAPIGQAVEIAGWSLVVNSVTPDGTAAVMAENQFNDPPAEGRQFFLANISATYVDGESESSNLFSDISVSALGPSSVEYQEFSDRCGVIPDEIDSFKDVFEGGTVTGNICWAVTTDDAAALVMYAEASFSLDDERKWWGLTQ